MTRSDKSACRIAVLGGGITGLSAAYTLARARQAGAPIEEYLIEASERLGGSIRTERVEDFVVEGGPDSFLGEKPEAAALCRELGLEDSLLGSNDRERSTYILHRGRMVPLPTGMRLFIPTRLWPVLTTSLFPLGDKLGFLIKWLAPWSSRNFKGHSAPREPTQRVDESVASFVQRHFGRSVLENIAEPLLAGIFGGDSASLSVRSALPRLVEMEEKYGNLLRAVREIGLGFRPAPTATAPPLFMTLREGLEQMVTELKKHLDHDRLHLGERTVAVEQASAGSVGAIAAAPVPSATSDVSRQYRIRCEGGNRMTLAQRSYSADAIIFALPAYECGRLLTPLDPALGELLKTIPYTSAVTVALGYDTKAYEKLPSGFGFLVPKKEKRMLLACTFVHNKFPHRAPPGKALLRCFLGGSGDPEVINFGDEKIVDIVRQELRAVLNLCDEPLFYRVYRWPSAMPQYIVGHSQLLNSIGRRLERQPGLFLAGNAYTGVGISDCIREGRLAADRALGHLRSEGFRGTMNFV